MREEAERDLADDQEAYDGGLAADADEEEDQWRAARRRADGARERDPSSLNHRWGAYFRMSLKRDGGTYSWECSCPYHRKNASTGCKKTLKVEETDDIAWDDASEATLGALRDWANSASDYDRQWKHMGQSSDGWRSPPDGGLTSAANCHPTSR